jgi:DNA-binding transcriptional regulator YbjK
MPPSNEQRRTELTDAAIDIVVREGLHGLSHRAVDEAANVPRGTTSNYFRSRDALLEATTRRLMKLHFTLMKRQRPEQLGRGSLIEFISGVLEDALTEHPGRYLAMLELALESTRDPEMQRAFVGMTDEAMQLTYDVHGAEERVPGKDVQLLSVFYNGVLFTCLVMPEILAGRSPGEITRDGLEKLL